MLALTYLYNSVFADSVYIVFTCTPHLKIYQRNLICTNNTRLNLRQVSTRMYSIMQLVI
jgi:hypothetical protein